VKKLIDGLQFYRDKLHEPKVFERFTEILAKVRGLRAVLFIVKVLTMRFFYSKARANKSKDKPDVELNEFEKVYNPPNP
jgi:condensin complex subunit 1